MKSAERLIISGVHMELTDALKNIVAEKVDKLFKHEDQIIRVRVELEYHANKSKQEQFIAKGQVEINGPDMVVAEASDDLYKSIDGMVLKLDRMRRQRARLSRVKRKQPKDIDIPAALPKVSRSKKTA